MGLTQPKRLQRQQARRGGPDALCGLRGQSLPSHGQRHLPRVPLGRVLDPSEIASLAVYLGLHESRGMTGQSIHLDGGMVLS